MVHDIRRKTEIKEVYDRYLWEKDNKTYCNSKNISWGHFSALYKIQEFSSQRVTVLEVEGLW